MTQTVQTSTDLLLRKNASYNPDRDVLASFRRAAAITGSTPEQALGGMLSKHVVSIYDLLEKQGPDMDRIPVEVWDEKILDVINYMILLRAILLEVPEKTFEVDKIYAESFDQTRKPLNH